MACRPRSRSACTASAAATRRCARPVRRSWDPGSVGRSGYETLFDEHGHEHVTDLLRHAARGVDVDAAREAAPDQFAAVGIDREYVGLKVGLSIGLDVSGAVHGVPVAVIAPAPAIPQAGIARHPVVTQARTD